MAKVSKSESSATAIASTVAKPAAVAVKEKAPKAAKAVAAAATAAAPAVVEAKVSKKAAATAEPAVVDQPPKKKSKTSAATPAAPAATAPVAVVAVEGSEGVVAAAVVEPINTDFTDFLTKLQQVSSMFSALKTDFRTLEKKASRELKSASKAGAKRKRKTGNRSPSGFVKPTLISADLATFLGKPAGSEMARTEVTREINKYIRENNLQDTANGRKINADAKLAALLKIDTAVEELTYFNLQRYMSPHFAKKDGAAVVASA
jgi:hypothetical protein